MKKLAIILAGLLLMAATAAMAEVPKTINYQARLTDLAGNPLSDVSRSITIRLYDSATAALGTEIWEDTFDVRTKNGFFNVMLGSGAAFPGTIDFSKQYWVGIKVEGDDEMTDRLPLASVPYAMRAETANTANTATAVADNCVTSAKIATNAVVAAKIADGAVSTQAKAPWAPTVNNGILNPKIHFGVVNSDVSGNASISFPASYAGIPAVYCTVYQTGETIQHYANVENVTVSGASINTWAEDINGVFIHKGPVQVNWLSIGQ